MSEKWNSESSNGSGLSRVGLYKFLFIVLLFTLFFLLARSMVHHHFGGGAQDNRQSQH